MNFAVLWGILYFGSFAAFAGIIGLIVQIILAGWFAAYRFAVIESAAAGDDDLPSVAMIGEGLVDGVILPLFHWVGSWIVVLLPAIVYAGVMASSGDMEALERFFSASPADKSLVYLAEEDPVLALLMAVGYIMWPMVVLCVALGGFSCLYRLDLLVLTIVRTLGIYSLVVLLVFGCEAAKAALEMTVSFRFLGLLAVGITVYFEIVTARVIGLYYHHFKQRFAWDWG